MQHRSLLFLPLRTRLLEIKIASHLNRSSNSTELPNRAHDAVANPQNLNAFLSTSDALYALAPLVHRNHCGCLWCTKYWRAGHADDAEDIPFCRGGCYECHTGCTSHQGDHQCGQEYQHTHHHGASNCPGTVVDSKFGSGSKPDISNCLPLIMKRTAPPLRAQIPAGRQAKLAVLCCSMLLSTKFPKKNACRCRC